IDEVVILPSVIGFQVVPPSVVFHAPPPVAPNQYSFGRESLPSAEIDRPPRAGPTFLQRMPEYRFGSTVVEELPCCATTDDVNENATTTTDKRLSLIAEYSTVRPLPRHG